MKIGAHQTLSGVRYSFAATFMGPGMHMLIAYMCITASRNRKHQQQPHRGKIPWHPPSRPLPFYSIPVLPIITTQKRRHRKSESMDGRGRRRQRTNIYKQTSSVGTYIPHTHTWGDHDHGKPIWAMQMRLCLCASLPRLPRAR